MKKLVFILTILLLLTISLGLPCKLCLKGFHCVDGICVPYVPMCLKDSDCQKNQVCQGGSCITKPLKPCFILCIKGYHCFNGTCIPDYPICTKDSDCKPNQICQDGKCAILKPCTLFCLIGFHCYNGTCVPNYTVCSKDSDCKQNQICKDSICTILKPCTLLCLKGFHCFNETCIPDQTICSDDSQCKTNQICQNGSCIQKVIKICKFVCKNGYSCVDGQCVLIDPPPIDKCQSRKCENNKDCGINEVCKDGICIDKCASVICPLTGTSNDECCQKIQCSRIFCPDGTICKNLKCVPDISVCPINIEYEATVCKDPRPDEKTCPIIYYFRAPDLIYCGIKADGTRIGFARQCQACKDISIVYYYNSPCYQVPFTCSSSESCLDYYCSAGCKNNQECPYDWQVCSNGECVDRCALLRCDKCKFGQCNYQEANGECIFGSKSGCKKDTWQCVAGQCADLCLRTCCPPNYKCNSKYGNCQPLKVA